MIFKNKSYDKPFVQVSKDIINRPDLSAKAKGILIYLLSKPPDWEVRTMDIVNRMSDGKTAVQSGLNELERAGYIVRYQERTGGGKFAEWVYNVYEVPVTEEGYTPKSGKPASVKPASVKPASGNLSLTNNDSTNNKVTNNKGAGMDLLDGMLHFEKERLKRTNIEIDDYPADVQDVIRAFCEAWEMPAPGKKVKSKYALWVKVTRELMLACHDAGVNPVDAVRECRRMGGDYSVYGIQSIQNTIWGAISNLQKGVKSTKTYYDADGNKVER